MSYTEPTTTPVEAWAIALFAITIASPIIDIFDSEEAALQAYEDAEFFSYNSAPAYDTARDCVADEAWAVIDAIVSDNLTLDDAREGFEMCKLAPKDWADGYWEALQSRWEYDHDL